LKASEKEFDRQQRAERCDPNVPMTDAERRACYQRSMQQLQEQQRQEAERRRQIELEERRTRAMEEAAQAQREQAETARRPRTCKTVGYQMGRPIVECYYPNIPATRNDP